MIEHFFQCPYCWENISMFLEPLAEAQHYVEDCEVCCRPIQIDYLFSAGELMDFRAESLGQ